MFVGSVIGWAVVGMVIGGLGRLAIPGRQNIGIVVTSVLGVVGAIIGGFTSSMVLGPNIILEGSENYDFKSAWPGWIIAGVGSIAALWLVASGSPRVRRTL